jgi:protease I
MPNIQDLRIAAIATDGVEESELLEPLRALKANGAHVDVLSLKTGPIQCVRHMDKSLQVEANKAVKDARPDDYDALLLPGGAVNADTLRVDKDVQRFVQSFDKEKKPMAIICHAPWILISSNIVRGRTLTGYHTIEDDVRNAGGHWVDREVNCDFNWVTSRQPSDLPAFIEAMMDSFAEFSQKTQRA